MECRISDVIGFNLRSSLDCRGEKLRHFRIRAAVVSLGILCLVPHTDSERLPSALGDKRNFVLESFLFSKQRKDVLLQPLGELRNTIGLQMHINSACKHDTLLAPRCQRGNSDNHYWFRYS